jgi:hypothetical protein
MAPAAVRGTTYELNGIALYCDDAGAGTEDPLNNWATVATGYAPFGSFCVDSGLLGLNPISYVGSQFYGCPILISCAHP